MGKYTSHRTSPTYDEIAQLAFSLHESRERQDGDHIEDWPRAEQGLVRHYAELRRFDPYTRRIEMASVKQKVNLCRSQK